MGVCCSALETLLPYWVCKKIFVLDIKIFPCASHRGALTFGALQGTVIDGLLESKPLVVDGFSTQIMASLGEKEVPIDHKHVHVETRKLDEVITVTA